MGTHRKIFSAPDAPKEWCAWMEMLTSTSLAENFSFSDIQEVALEVGKPCQAVRIRSFHDHSEPGQSTTQQDVPSLLTHGKVLLLFMLSEDTALLSDTRQELSIRLQTDAPPVVLQEDEPKLLGLRLRSCTTKVEHSCERRVRSYGLGRPTQDEVDWAYLRLFGPTCLVLLALTANSMALWALITLSAVLCLWTPLDVVLKKHLVLVLNEMKTERNVEKQVSLRVAQFTVPIFKTKHSLHSTTIVPSDALRRLLAVGRHQC